MFLAEGRPGRKLRVVVACSLLLLMSSCATMLSPRTQQIPVSSIPEGAEVAIDGEFVGTTPLVIEVAASADHEITLRYGSEVRSWRLTRQPSPGGAIGLSLDVALLAGAGALGIAAIDSPFAGGSDSGGARTTAVLVLVAVGAAPLVYDLAVDEYYELIPVEIEVEFE